MSFLTLRKSLPSFLTWRAKVVTANPWRQSSCTLLVSTLFYWRKKKKSYYESHLLIPSEVKQKLLLIWNSNSFTVSVKRRMFIFLLSAELSSRYFSYGITNKCTGIYTCFYTLYPRRKRGTDFITSVQINLQIYWFFKLRSDHQKVTK